MKLHAILLLVLSMLTGCVTTKQKQIPPEPFVEPASWTNAVEFSDFKSGMFFIDNPETAVYLKNMGKYEIEGISPLQQLSLEGIDILLFSPFSSCHQTVKGRLEDTILRYSYFEISREKTDEKVVVYQNAFGVKRDVIHTESDALGIYFSNTAEKDYLNQLTRYKTTPGFVVEQDDFKLVLKRADAEVAGKDAVVRIYFTLDMEAPPIKYTYDSDVGLAHSKGISRAIGESFKSKTHHTLYKAKLHGVKIIYKGNIFAPNPTAIVE